MAESCPLHWLNVLQSISKLSASDSNNTKFTIIADDQLLFSKLQKNKEHK